MRQKIRERVDIALADPESLIDSLRTSSFTGVVKIKHSGGEEAVAFEEGIPLAVVSQRDDYSVRIPFQDYNLPREGSVEVIETDSLSLMNLLRGRVSPQEEGPLILAGYGDYLQQPMHSHHVNLDALLELSAKNSVSGYILLHTSLSPLGMIVLYEGKPVMCYARGGLTGERAEQSFTRFLKDCYITPLITDPVIIPLIISLARIQLMRSGKIKNVGDFERLKDEVAHSGQSSLIDLNPGKGRRFFILNFKGSQVCAVERDPFSVKDADFPPALPASYDLYPLYVNPKPREVTVNLEARKPEAPVEGKIVENIKSSLRDAVGSVADILWDKVLEETEISEESMTLSEASKLVRILAREIPNHKQRENFLKKGKAILSGA